MIIVDVGHFFTYRIYEKGHVKMHTYMHIGVFVSVYVERSNAAAQGKSGI